ncbi:hypothetical protein RRG08_014227 [Elysia crispata]|uniref:Uncharacterized protein n=1 Tax=Elysia crispata TaxID=231223 RepID=A0AAE1CEZ7_9GAST|nr:hypothetical protein RRG08_014227 [Elysia crispata]
MDQRCGTHAQTSHGKACLGHTLVLTHRCRTHALSYLFDEPARAREATQTSGGALQLLEQAGPALAN